MTPQGTSTLVTLAVLVAVTAILHLAREVLIPLALAILLSFLLAPAVRSLERLRLGRLASTALVVAAAFSLIGGVAWIAGAQAVSLVGKLPEYRVNIEKKIRALKAPREGSIGKAAKALEQLEKQASPTARPPLPVQRAPDSAFEQLADMLAPVARPAATAFAVIVFTVLMLLNRESMRDRLIGLIGARRISLTTQALGEASQRVSRFLFTQLVVNACFGIPFGAALYFIGVPNALLWGVLATLLRFIPYAGVWIAAAMPVLLALAISDGWTMVAWTVGVFLALELVMVNAVEPWAYGRSAGLSTIAIIAAAIFWTWLWGPIGLLLATPLTVCVAVIGRYVPEMGFLNVILGVEPVLPDEARFYQRLVAKDPEASLEMAEAYLKEHDFEALCGKVLVPALGLAERDRHAGTLDEASIRFIFDTTRSIIEELGGESEAPPGAGPTVLIVSARDEADHLAGQMLGRLLRDRDLNPRVLPSEVLAGELLEEIAQRRVGIVCISAVPPYAATQAGQLCRRLKKRVPGLRVLVGLWITEGSLETAQPRLVAAGADELVSGLAEAAEWLRQQALLERAPPLAVAIRP